MVRFKHFLSKISSHFPSAVPGFISVLFLCPFTLFFHFVSRFETDVSADYVHDVSLRIMSTQMISLQMMHSRMLSLQTMSIQFHVSAADVPVKDVYCQIVCTDDVHVSADDDLR